jgi:hypothetical protein
MALTLEQVLDFLAPDETLGQLFGRLGRERLSSGLQAVDRHLELRPGVFLEACGGACCGKTELLLQVLVFWLCSDREMREQTMAKRLLVPRSACSAASALFLWSTK